MRALLLPAVFVVLVGASCGGDGELERSRIFDSDAGAGASAGTGLLDVGVHDGPPAADASDLCGNVVIQVLSQVNLYWVLDRSGSMKEVLPGTVRSKYLASRYAIRDVMHAIGHRVSLGAAVFPAPHNQDPGCSPGAEVFPTRPGDPATFGLNGETGPVLGELLKVLAGLSPVGGTPTSATLAAISPTVIGLEGETAVVLATDGAPNCNDELPCGVDECMLNLEGVCPVPENCCDPALGYAGYWQCLDAEPTRSVITAWADAGVRTYVVGMPGSELYGALLDELAVIGGTAREGPTKYYAATNASQLSLQLLEIGTAVAVKCQVELEEAPANSKFVNVYLDGQVVPYDEQNGWAFAGPKTVELRGQRCDDLKAGVYAEVQVAVGCPTHVL